MPLYEYQCSACGERFEVIQRFADAPIEVCRKCGGGPVERMLSAPAIQFKGTGWYITDYARKGKGETATVSSNGSNGNGSKPAESTAPAAPPASTATDKAGDKK
ncbi:MAG: zinc ribbon domain-containing protein [Acidobacteria bacterium]|nr:zinc ribbon domain-containing protein [Acidobacteriota bacterium]